MLIGKKVMLRPVKRSDLTHFLRWFNDPEVVQCIGEYLPMTEMGEEKRIEELGTTRARTDAVFVIESVGGDACKPIGITELLGINSKDHNAGFGIAIGEKDYWSKGYGTEAAALIIRYGFEQLNLHRINSSVIGFNERSIRMHRKLGFLEEGTQREGIYKNGRYHDHLLFGLLRSEWERT